MGEAAYQAFLIDIARRSRLSHALIGILASALFIVLAGATVLMFYPSPTVDWGFWLGLGIVGYGFVVAFYGALWIFRLFRKASSLHEKRGATQLAGEASRSK